MKKLIFSLSLFTLLFASCKNDVPAPPTPMPAVPVPAAPSATPPATPPAAPKMQTDDVTKTSVSVGKDGVDVNTNKTKVSVDVTGTSVNVKK